MTRPYDPTGLKVSQMSVLVTVTTSVRASSVFPRLGMPVEQCLHIQHCLCQATLDRSVRDGERRPTPRRVLHGQEKARRGRDALVRALDVIRCGRSPWSSTPWSRQSPSS